MILDGAIAQSKGGSSGRIHAVAAELLGETLVPGARFVDVGCGEGLFAERVASLGVREVHACDAGRFHPRVDRFSFTQVNLNARLGYSDAHFDVVAALEVIEHLENPRYFTRELFRILRPGGTLLLSTPNNESLTSLLSLAARGYFSAFADSCYPAHITPVLAIDGRRMLREAGFGEASLHWSGEGRVPALNLHWQSLFGPFAGGKWFSDNFFLRARR